MIPLFSRRRWLSVAAPAGLGVGLTPWSWLTGAVPPSRKKGGGFGGAKSVLLVYASGGQSQLDTWDPKPDAPAEIRGAFGSIATAVPGTRLCEHMPRLARLADRYTIVRSVAHEDQDHGSATYLALTGQYHPRKSSNPPPLPGDMPTYGAILKRVRPARNFPYTAIHVNGPVLVPTEASPGQFAGFLGRSAEPLVLNDVSATPTAMRGLDATPELTDARRRARQALLDRLEQASGRPGGPRTADRDILYQQAHALLSSPQCRQAFDLSREKDAVREKYGRYRSGQACMLARRLVEAGVPFITVFLNHSIRGQDRTPDETETYGWDTHNDIFDALKVHLLPRFDQTFATLLEDLDERGLLEQTLVVCMGEFGRAPRVALEASFAGSSPGRKHWASVYSVVLAGAGVTRGAVVGSSDRIGGHPKSTPVGPWDLAATLFAALGIEAETPYQDPAGRPFPIATGKPIRELYH